jgi:hypothetical protein
MFTFVNVNLGSMGVVAECSLKTTVSTDSFLLSYLTSRLAWNILLNSEWMEFF